MLCHIEWLYSMDLYVRWRIDAFHVGPGEPDSGLLCGHGSAAAYMEVYTATVRFAA